MLRNETILFWMLLRASQENLRTQNERRTSVFAVQRMWVCVCVRRVPTAWRHCSNNTVAATATANGKSISRMCDVRYCLSVCVYARARMSEYMYIYAHRPISRSRAKQRRTTSRPMCRTGSVSIRPDSCGLLYAPQVLSFLHPFSLLSPFIVAPPLIFLQFVRSFFRSLTLCA